MATGEGKSFIIAGIAAILALKGFKVDIVTSSPVLAERDASDNKKLFESMGLKCASNIDSKTKPYLSGAK